VEAAAALAASAVVASVAVVLVEIIKFFLDIQYLLQRAGVFFDGGAIFQIAQEKVRGLKG
jgi:hypothetical protein